MRNDARPIGHDSPHAALRNPQPDDARESVTHDRQSHIVNQRTEEDARRGDLDVDPVMPASDSSLPTKI
jgi:hypothetical protein